MKQMLRLNQNWALATENGREFSTNIPSSVYQVLYENGAIEDPYWGANEDKVLDLSNLDYTYYTVFDVPEEILEKNCTVLEFEGIDTLADIYLNGILLGHTNNMHCKWRYDVKNVLKEYGNKLIVALQSPTRFIREAHEKCVCNGAPDCMKGFPHLRKAHSMFGWDWGPRLPDLGIFRNVNLWGYEESRIEDIRILQHHSENCVELGIEVTVGGSEEGCDYSVHLRAPDGMCTVYEGSPSQLTIENAELWWPNGYGAQPLYELEIRLMRGQCVLDSVSKRIGLRTMTLDTSRDQWGTRFAHVVNGVEVFAMGANYIPQDSILGRTSHERSRELLTQCKECNFNLIRVWGGGYYPDDDFFDLCDEMGLIVWQDFMFACAVYDMNEQFEASVTEEIRQNIRRIRHHACLGLWCGNNEIEMCIDHKEWEVSQRQKSDYVYLSEYMIPRIVKELDPQTAYWSSSPTSGGSFDWANDESRGDGHYWEVWHGGAPFTEYRKHFFRYLSEFGFQSFPCLRTVESFTAPEDRNIFSYVMEKHQRNGAANGKILHYLSQTFLYPNRFELLLYASQLLQAEAIKYGVEHFRRNRGRCMGTVYWQLNDCWPVASWSSIDYFGRWKALQYYAKRFYAPILLSCEEEGCLTQGVNINAEGYHIEKSVVFSVANETQQDEQLQVKWFLCGPGAEVLVQGSCDVKVQALGVWKSDRIFFEEAALRRSYVYYELWQGDHCISQSATLFCPPKHFEFEDPELRVEVYGKKVFVHARKFAKSVELYSPDSDVKLSDNFFDMNGGTREIEILTGQADTLCARSVFDIR